MSTASRLVIRLTSGVVLSLLLAGVPWLLITTAGWPLPAHVPTGDELGQWLTSPLPDTVYTDAAALAGWITWAQFTAHVVAELPGRRRPPTRGVGRGPLRALAALLVAGALAAPAQALAAPASPATATAPASTATTAVTAASAPTAPAEAQPTPGTIAASGKDTQVKFVIRGQRHHVIVRPGDTMSKIAKQWLGDADRWPEICKLNLHRHWPKVGGTLRDCDLLYPRWDLRLPDDARPPTAAVPARPQPAAATQEQLRALDLPPMDNELHASAAPASPAAPSIAALPTPTASAAEQQVPTVALSPAGMNSADEGVQLPGGWAPIGLAAALAAAAGLVMRRRRAGYVPAPIDAPLPADNATSLPVAFVGLLRRALHRTSRPNNPTDTAAAEQSGPTGAQLAGADDLPLTAGLGLIGPGALDAARGILVATLSSGHRDDPDAQGQAVMPTETLQTLLGTAAEAVTPVRRLHVTDTIGEAVAFLEEEIIRRSRIVADAQTTEAVDLHRPDAYAEPLPQLLLIAGTPDPRWHTRLATAVALGESVGIGTVIIGEWPRGTTVEVAADGTTTGAGGHRLAVLDTGTATQALQMLREAHGDTADVQPLATVSARQDGQVPPTASRRARRTDRSRQQPPVRVKVLGTPAVLDQAGRPAPRLRTAAKELMVYLVMHRDGAPIGDILEAIYPDATVSRASERLSTDVANLRRVIRAVAGPTDDGRRLEPVVNSGGHYRLNADVVDADWWTIIDEYAQVAVAPDEQHRLKHLRAALAEISGPLAQGCLYEWSTTDEERVRRCTLTIYAQAAAIFADSDPHQARALLDAACAVDPLSEALAVRAMRAAAAQRDIDAIGHRLAILTRALHQAGLELSEQTATIAQQLLSDLTTDPDH